MAHYTSRWLAGAVASFLLTLALPALAQGQTDVQRCEKGHNSPDEAISACTAIIKSGRAPPQGLARAYNFLANALAAKNNLDGAIANYDEAIRLSPSFSTFYSNRSDVWTRKGEFARAIADADAAIRFDARSVRGYSSRAGALDAQGSFDRAIADYDQAVRLDPNLALTYARRSNTLRRKGDLERAMADAELAIRLDPKLAFAYNSRGNVLAGKDDHERAIAAYSEAIRLGPTVAVYYSNRGSAWRRSGDLVRAIADLDQAIRLDPARVPAYTHRGLAFEAKGDRERARSDFNAALAMPPRDTVSKKAQDTARVRLSLLADEPAPKTAVPTPSSAVAAPSLQPSTEGGKRVALVIGNGAYVSAGALLNPANDARAVARALREIGFDVSEGTDLDFTAQERVVRDFLRKAATARIALLFYAGHGMQIDGKNYLVPVDARLTARSDLAFATLELDKVLAGLDDETRTNIIILDACRDNPLGKNLASAPSTASRAGLAAVSSVGSGTLVVFATAPDRVALDGVGTNSPFTAALVEHLRTPGLEVRQMLTRVRADVLAATQKKQVPWDNSSLLGDVYLVRGSKL